MAQLEALYAALSVGACTHLLNPQLDPEQALALVRQAAPRLLLHDDTTAPLARQLHAALGAETALLSTNVSWGTATAAREVAFNEELPALACYSSGTTGMPKGVEYTHRSTVLHAWACAMPDAMNLGAADRVMPCSSIQRYHCAGSRCGGTSTSAAPTSGQTKGAPQALA